MNMIQPFLYKLLSFLVVIFSVWLGTWVFLANRKSKINRLFFLMALSVSFWIGFYYLTITASSPSSALFWSKLAYGAVSIFYIPFYFFFISFLNLEKKFFWLNKIVLFGAIFFFFTSIFTNWIVKEAVFRDHRVDLVFSKGSIGFYGMAIFLSVIVVVALSKKYFELSLSEKLKIQYFLIGAFIWIFMNFLFNMILPIWWKSVRYAEFGNYSAIFLLGFTAYAIVKRELFGIRVVLTEILVGAIAILLFLQVIISKSTFEYIWKSLLLILFLFFGYSLVKSVIREIKYREQLQRAFEKLKELDKAKSEFISIASHQLRTPLTAIKGYISMILEGSYGEISEKIKRPLESVYKSNERLIKLVNDLLNISRIESGKIELKVAPFSIEEIIKSVIEELKIEAEKKKIYLKFEELKKKLPKIKIDGEKIRQVILNVIDNAIRYTDKGGVKVKAYKINDKIRIEVSDTGAGMTKEELSKIFESFSRAGAGTRLYTEGVGLGLYVARRFVEMHNGKIWAESPGKGKGSTFFIELPIK